MGDTNPKVTDRIWRFPVRQFSVNNGVCNANVPIPYFPFLEKPRRSISYFNSVEEFGTSTSSEQNVCFAFWVVSYLFFVGN